MSVRRNRLEIVNDILKSIQDKGGSIKPTHLLYKSNLSHDRMKSYIAELKEKGLISEELKANKKIIVITTKGFEFLVNYKKIKEFEEAFGI
ncbi:MAG: winged helix-turn-helix domain-containing protein [Candidatus Woesearchaeota archaeon]